MSASPSPSNPISTTPPHPSLFTMLRDSTPGQDHARQLDRSEKREAELQEYDLSAIRLDIIRMQAQFDTRMQRTERVIEALVENMMTWRQDFVDSMREVLEAEKATITEEHDKQRLLVSRHSQAAAMKDDDGGNHRDEDEVMMTSLKDDIKDLQCSVLMYRDSVRENVETRLDSIQVQMKELTERIRVQQHVVTTVVQQYHQHVQLQQQQAQQCQQMIGQLQQRQQQQHQQQQHQQQQHQHQQQQHQQQQHQQPQHQQQQQSPSMSSATKRPVGRPRKTIPHNSQVQFLPCSGVRGAPGTCTSMGRPIGADMTSINSATAPMPRPTFMPATIHITSPPTMYATATTSTPMATPTITSASVPNMPATTSQQAA